ncbi:tRNA (adenosine(37)-N6)-threonylcarbamoyltransferase complex transferase subunit TsaD [Candidatus Peregrinibacteria bacterium]|nr:tRNA (adenosine(37)-N6)-threonylcarbamoyltransferase complex transferase subunit TsaD [Candidatus Peregrinibacteria bacterium]
MVKILGIETSCDETAVAVAEDGVHVLGNAIASSAEMHGLIGGVVPEVAAREQLKAILPVIDLAMAQAKTDWNAIDAIAVTNGPGLISSLLVGVNVAATLAYIHKKPLIPIHHIAGHIYANFLDGAAPVSFPFLVLTVSGGHNELILVRDHFDFQKIGETIDDAAGEAFDKVARLLGLGYPGGPPISKWAEKGNPKAFDFPRSHLDPNHRFDFSFSGLKTAVMRAIVGARHALPLPNGAMTDAVKADLAASFQQAVVDILSDKLADAAREYDVSIVHLAGGVSANRLLRQEVRKKLPPDVALCSPQNLKYCTDNGAMIAGAGYFFSQKYPLPNNSWSTIRANANLEFPIYNFH